MKCPLLLTLALTASSAWATGTPASEHTSSASHAEADSLATSSARSDATSMANQHQTASGTASQSQTAQGGSSQAVNSGNNAAQSLTYNSTAKRNAPAMYAPTVYASTACAYGWSAGISTPVGGASGGKAKIDQQCDYRENIRIVAALNPALALRVACAVLDGFRHVPDSECVYTPPVAEDDPPVTVIVPAAPVADSSGYVTKQELEQAFKRAVSK